MPNPTRALPPNALLHPIWAIRFFAVMPLLLVGAALIFSHSIRDMLLHVCLGAAFGILIGASIFAFQVEDITLKVPEQPSDADRYSLN